MTTRNLIDTTFVPKNISGAISVYEYTATGTMRLRFQVRLYQVVGGGDYTINLRLNDGDAQADDPVVPKTIYTAAAGVQNFWFPSSDIDVLAGDVINVMVVGQALDAAVTGSVRIFTDDNVATLADDAITSAAFDELTAFPIKSADTGSTQVARVGADSDTLETLSDQLDAIPTATEIDAQLSGVHGSGSWGVGNGGALSLTYSVYSDNDKTDVVEGATVELYATPGMETILDSQVTDVLGQVTFERLVAGTYYLYIHKAGYTPYTDSEDVA
jgi:hypothetical protein